MFIEDFILVRYVYYLFFHNFKRHTQLVKKMHKLTPNDIIKIVWGDNDRKIAGNVFIKLYKKFENKVTRIPNTLRIRYPKIIIIKELRAHGLSNRDIHYIRQLISKAIKDELYNIRKEFSIPVVDAFYTDETFERYSLNSVHKPIISALMNTRSRKLAEELIHKSRYKLEYYND